MMVDVQPGLLRAIVLSDDTEMQGRLLHALALHGFQALPASAPAELYRLTGQSPQSICVLDASRHDGQVLALIAQLRRVCSIGIVVIVDPTHFEVRVNALLIGADACLATPVEPRELAALMLGVSRRLSCTRAPEFVTEAWRTTSAGLEAMPNPVHEAESAAAGQRSGWALIESGWVLVSPEALRLELSRSERALMLAMAERHDTVMSREVLLAMMDGKSGDGDDNDACSAHRISMLLSRMRKKARKVGMRLPIRVVRGQGYELIEEITGHERQGRSPE